MATPTTTTYFTENSRRYGMPSGTLVWNEDFKARRDDKGKYTCSESFTCPIISLTTLIPKNGTNCQFPGFSFCTLTDVSIENIEGDLAQVTCNFSGYSSAEFTFDETTNVGNYTYDLNIQINSNPIESHPKFVIDDPIPHSDLIVIKNFRAGLFKPKSEVEGDKYKFVSLDDQNPSAPAVFEVTSAKGKKLVDYMIKGLDTWASPQQIWRVSYTTETRPSNSKYNDIGKVVTPPGAPNVSDDRDWLFQGMTVQEVNKIFSVTEEYALSDRGGYDQFLYGDSDT